MLTFLYSYFVLFSLWRRQVGRPYSDTRHATTPYKLAFYYYYYYVDAKRIGRCFLLLAFHYKFLWSIRHIALYAFLNLLTSLDCCFIFVEYFLAIKNANFKRLSCFILDMPRSLIAIDCTKIYIGILDLNKLALLCCSLG